MKYFVISLCLIQLLSGVALACSCAPPDPPIESLKKVTAVFIGKVKNIREVSWENKVTVEVSKVYKGDLGREVIISTGIGGGDCGYPFQKNSQYLIYAWRSPEGSLQTGICLRTKPLDKALEEIKELDSYIDTQGE